MKILRIILIVLVLGGAGYLAYHFFGSSSTSNTTVQPLTSRVAPATTVDASATTQVGDDFLRLLLSLKRISLNTTFFDTPTYRSLQDYSVPIFSDGTEGRVNPFAPIGQDPVTIAPTVSVTTSQPTQITKTTALFTGMLPNGVVASERYFEYSVASASGTMIQTAKVAQSPTTGIFTFQISALTPDTVYSVRAVAKIGQTLYQGQLLQFKTLK